MSSSGSNSPLFVKTPSEPKLSVSTVPKPPTVDGICPENVPKKCLPHIKAAGDGEKKKLCSFEPVKRNVTLPKLKSKMVPQQRGEAGEPFTWCLPDYYYKQSSESVSSDKESEVFEPLPWDHESTSLSLIGGDDGNAEVVNESVMSALKERVEEIMRLRDKDEKLEKSHALERWEFWLKDKKRIQNYLSKKVGRKAQDLMLQESDKYRGFLQNKFLHLYPHFVKTKEGTEETPLRWKPTMNIASKKNLQESQECVEEETKRVKITKPRMDFIHIPELIKREKGLVDDSESSGTNNTFRWQFRTKKRNQDSGLNKTVDQLAVVGTGVVRDSKSNEFSVPFKNLPEIILTEDDEKCYPNERKSVFCLVIEGEEVKYEIGTYFSQDPDKKFTWAVNFGVQTAGRIVEKALRVENRGTMTVKYEWLSPKFEQTVSLGLLQPKRHEPWFYFNKNSGFFLPGQVYDFKIYLQAKASGIRKETWFLKTTPPFSDTQGQATITISAVATEKFFEQTKSLETYLEKRAKESMASFLFDVILQKVFRVCENLRGVEYPSIFCEKELFEFHNIKHYYHSVFVKELHEIFNEIPMKTQTDWDYSVDSLIYLVKTYKTGRERNICLEEIAKITKKLFKPNYVSTKTVRKYKMSYEILCNVANSMEHDYEYLKKVLSEKTEPSGEDVYNYEESKDSLVSSSVLGGELGEFHSEFISTEMKPINHVFFQTMFYIKVYNHVCKAVESIAGVLETEKLFTRRKNFNCIPEKPTKRLTTQSKLTLESA